VAVWTPGDMYYRGPNVTFYFPIVSCLVLSATLNFLQRLWRGA
jgi:hypothetical protein